MRIGVDFDNTIAGYDLAFFRSAMARGLISPDQGGTKKEIRDAIRCLEGGELEWQRLQGQVYGAMMDEARMFEGVGSFLRRCREEDGCELFIVSHKTEFGHHDPDLVNLRAAALSWMEKHAFFSPEGFAIPRENVFFESTLREKISRIAALNCACFIDDLEEVFANEAFPRNVRRILYTNGGENCGGDPTLERCSTWHEITKTVFL